MPQAKITNKPRNRLTGRDAMWRAIRTVGLAVSEFHLGDLALDLHPDTLRSFLRDLTRGQIIETRPATKPGQRTSYRLVDDPGAETPRIRADGTLDRTPSKQERMWLAMKPLGAFTQAELALACAPHVTEVQAKSYIGDLNRAGYLTIVEPARAGSGSTCRARYALRMARDTGPLPPAIRRSGEVYDRNLQRILKAEDVL